MPGTLERIHFAPSWPRPAGRRRRGCSTFRVRPRSRTFFMYSRNIGTSKQYWLCTNCAPASIFLAEPIGAEVVGRGERVDRRAEKNLRRRGQLAAREELRIVAHDAHGFEQRHAVEVEDRLCARLVAGLHAVAGQAHDVGDAHGRAAQHVALDGDAVLVAAGDLHDRRITHAGQERADAHGGHVAVGAGRIDRVDAVHPAVEDRLARS
jgi:hypothetical protein